MSLEDPNVPYIETPDEHLPDGSERFCFMDAARPCTAECVAYLTARPEGRDYEQQAWSSCLLLVNAHKAGKHLVALAGQGGDLLKHMRVKSADAARPTPSIPTVR